MKHRIKQLILFLCTLVFIGNISVASADTASDTERLLNWAENNYPQYFPTQQTTQSFESWLFRYYSDTDVYVGVDTSNNGVYVFGGPWGNVNPTYIDSLSNLLSVAQVGNLTGIAAIWMHSLNSAIKARYILKHDGSVWTWWGVGDKSGRMDPVRIVGLNDITTISRNMHADHILALKKDGTVWEYGQRGTPKVLVDSIPKYTVNQVSGLTDIVAIANPNNSDGARTFYALKNDGTVWAWGLNDYGKLGNGPGPGILTPAEVVGLSNVTDIFAFGTSTFAIKADGTLWAWGRIVPWGTSQLDSDCNLCTSIPRQLLGLTDTVAVISEIYATKSDGTLWTWDIFERGTRGGSLDGYPVQINELTNVIDVISAPFEGENNLFNPGDMRQLALQGDGTVWKWTRFQSIAHDFTQISGLANITAISSSIGHVLALKSDGTVWAWGRNELGELGDGTTTSRDTPVQVLGLTGVIAIDTNTFGPLTSYALKDDGTLWAWGSLEHDQFRGGIADIYSTTPVQVGKP